MLKSPFLEVTPSTGLQFPSRPYTPWQIRYRLIVAARVRRFKSFVAVGQRKGKIAFSR